MMADREPLQLIGDKVVLRSFTCEDITPIYIGWLNDPEVVRLSNQRFRRHDADSCKAYLTSFSGTSNHFVGIRLRDSDRMIGTMTAYCTLQHGTADVGILVGDRTLWSQGIGRDAWCTMLAWLLERDDIRKVTAGTLACNHSMLKLMTVSGMHLEGIRRAQEVVEGTPQDLHYYARFKSA